ncbi:MAG: sigma-70 family RNA polymerase sigma factor [Lachnospiraceae bacterium]|nr:sigma-70 family RNA polymerase sigma factor [Lachnospiraceae bacterium]
MKTEHQIVKQVYDAKHDMQKADDLIRAYIPFIKAEVSKIIGRGCTDYDDEFSIGMIAFHEAIRGYTKERGAFLAYASMIMRSRLIDYRRKESRHEGNVSLNEEHDEDGLTLQDRLADDYDHAEELTNRNATRQEIEELSAVMAGFGVCLTDVAEHSPKQERTLDACRRVVNYAIEHPYILDELLKTKKLPLAQLTEGTGVERKTLERHRKYVLAMLLIQTNGYEIIRGHLKRVFKEKGGARI